MATIPKNRRGQFSLRSLLMGLTWLALILAICVYHQKAAKQYREALESEMQGLVRKTHAGGQGGATVTRSVPGNRGAGF
jgi:hypothetical protein